MKRIVAITGGIGSGKSVICHILSALNYSVYDCDSEAKRLMDSSHDIKRRIANEIATEAICPNGAINRKALSQCVFSDHKKLLKLNEIVHGAVRKHLSAWLQSQKSSTVFVETAILYESGLDSMVNEVWDVYAPEYVRIERVMRRSNLSVEEIERRIAAQSINGDVHPSHRLIFNDGHVPLLTQIFKLL